ncbi:MAG: metallophosphoesterase family protein, partial [Deltaproteobacteria bacterium]|nr:metallophosphoesterase family protein [Deltaproteobacteria bacterium]
MKKSYFFLLFKLFPAGLQAVQIEKGPFLQEWTENGAAVIWETSGNFSGSLKYGAGALDNEIVSPSNGFHHEIFLTGLKAGEVYDYAVFSNGMQVSEKYNFKTFAGKDAPFVFVVFGDNRSDHESHAKVVAKINEEDFDFLINTGDMVSSGDSEENWSKFFEIENGILHSSPMYPTIGNHDESDGDAKIYKRIFSVPTESSGLEEYYAFTIGKSRFIVLDGHVKIKSWLDCLLMGKLYDECFDKQQTDWLKKELEDSSQNKEIPHIFVITHMGPYSSKPGRTGSGQMRDFLDDFADAGVDMTFSGHDHYFEHGISVNGIHYFVTGGGGAPLYETDPSQSKILFPHEVIESVSVYNYLVVTVAGDYVKVVAKDI